MAAAGAVIGLERRHPQKFTDEREVEVQKKSSVEEQKVFFAPLRIAGEFQIAKAKVGMAADGDWRLAIGDWRFEKSFNRCTIAFHDELVG